MRLNNRTHRSEGFTLIELIVTISLLIVMMALAVPSFSALIRNNKAAALSNSIVTTINFARSEAVKRNESIEVCPVDGCAGDWKKGWRIQVKSSSTVIRSWEASDGDITITGGPIEFKGTGRLSGASIQMTTAHAGCTGKEKRLIRISGAGRVSVSRIDC